MNFRIISRLVGLLLLVFGASMTPALLCGLYYGDDSRGPLLLSMALTVAAGLMLILWGRRGRIDEIYRREATATVSLAWILSMIAGALPYYFAGLAEMPHFADCLFEATSGLTTTGSSVLTDIEALPKGLLFWRSWTHWIGGLGIIMLFVAVLPYIGAGGRALVMSEATGPVKEGLTPRIKDTAILLYRLYVGYTVAETVLLMMAGMSLFDALCHTFATLGTGGFSTRNASIGFYAEHGAIEVILIVFMILSACNFALINNVFRGRILTILRDGEWRFFMSIIAGSTLFIGAVLLSTRTYATLDEALRHSLFAVSTLVTSTGFVTEDFDVWPTPAKFLLVVLMCMGGCAGSTSGGIKMLRCFMLVKIFGALVEKVFRPRSVRRLRVGEIGLNEELQFATLGFFLIYGFVFIGSAFALSLLEMGNLDLVSSFTAIAATINGVGPGLGQLGAMENFGFLAVPSKILLCFVMLAGRLEFYALLVLFAPGFWRPS